mgnify:CR=1 FL=1
MSPKKYLKRVFDNYKKVFGEKPKQYTSPLEKGDHPEINTTEILGGKVINHFQSLVRSVSWAISLGRFDIAIAVMTLLSF